MFQLSMQRLLENYLKVDFLPEKCKHCSATALLFKRPLQPRIATINGVTCQFGAELSV